jgi:hypothetical protein
MALIILCMRSLSAQEVVLHARPLWEWSMLLPEKALTEPAGHCGFLVAKFV